VINRVLVCILVAAGLSCQSSQREDIPQKAAIADMSVMSRTTWSYYGDTGTQLISDNWNIRTTIQYEHILETLPAFFDAILDRYTTAFGQLPYPSERLNVYLFAKESQWQRKLEEILGSKAQKWFPLGRGGVTIDGTAVLYDLDKRGRSRATLRIAAHEGWHQYAEAVFENCLPTWLDEGIGTWMEGFRIRRGGVEFLPASNWDRLSALRRIVQEDRLTSLLILLNSDPSELLEVSRSSLLGYYAQLWAFTSFIMEANEGEYRSSLEKLLLDAVHGELEKPRTHGGWLSLFTEDPKLMEQEYREWVVLYVKPGGTWR
jgi:hypothetical protein